jgi:DNA-binding beta-propeller fold protein YncE
MYRVLIPLALTGCSSDFAFSGGSDDTEAGEYDTDYVFETGYSGGVADTGGRGEQEEDRLALRPAETDVFVFIANPENDSVTRVNVNTLEVRTTPVGDRPTSVAITPDWQTAAVFNQGDSSLSIINANTLDTTKIDVRPNMNRVVVSPGGRWAILWHDVGAERPDDPTPIGATSYNELSLVDVLSGEHFPLVIGFNAKAIRFTPDGSLALAVADANLATVDLRGDAPIASYLPIADPLNPPIAEEVEVSPDGAYAFIRQRGTDSLTVVDLDARTVSSIPVPAGPTDLDLTADGEELVLVSREAAKISRFRVRDPFDAAVVTDIPGGTQLGSILLSRTGDAVLFTNASDLGRYATWDLLADQITLHPLPKPAASMARTPDGGALLVVHDQADNDDGSTPPQYQGKSGMSLIDLDDQRTNTLALEAPISGYANANNGTRGYAILQGRSVLEVLDYTTLLHTELVLRSPTVFVGVLPDLDPTDGDEPSAWTNQDHPLGRITFYDPDVDRPSTITGFELNGQIED